ncbi:phage tail protein, partial [Cytobacillus purgationiresistens]|nr:phage-related protein [Cytobacillus purgationiresistens]
MSAAGGSANPESQYSTLGKTLNDLGESAQKAVAPLLALQAAALLGAQQSQAWKEYQENINSLNESLTPFAVALLQLTNTALVPLTAIISELSGWFSTLSPTIQMATIGFIGLLGFLPTIITFIGGLSSSVGLLITKLGPLFTRLLTLMTGMTSLSAVLSFLSGSFLLPLIGIAALVAGFIHAWQTSETFRNAVTTAVNSIVQVMQWAWPFIQMIIVGVFNNIKNVITGAIGIISGIMTLFANLFTGNWSGVWESALLIIKNAWQLIWNLVQLWGIGKVLGLVGKLKSSIVGIFTSMRASIVSRFSGMWSTLTSTVSSAMGAIGGLIRGAFTGILGWFTTLGASFFSAGQGLMDQIKNGIVNAANKVLSTVKDIAGKIRDFLPFSPAKVGPLSDLNKLDFASPWYVNTKLDNFFKVFKFIINWTYITKCPMNSY